MGVTGSDWLWLVSVAALCAIYGGVGCGIGYFIGRQHRKEDDAALLRRLARISRDMGYASLAMNKNRVQLLADADEAEKWAEAIDGTIDKPVNL
jgi:hypothetical protein